MLVWNSLVYIMGHVSQWGKQQTEKMDILSESLSYRYSSEMRDSTISNNMQENHSSIRINRPRIMRWYRDNDLMTTQWNEAQNHVELHGWYDHTIHHKHTITKLCTRHSQGSYRHWNAFFPGRSELAKTKFQGFPGLENLFFRTFQDTFHSQIWVT